LVVDDDTGVRSVAVRLLEFEGLVAVGAESGARALELVCQQRFDCVLLDLTMPMLSGAATFEELRRLEKTLPVVFSSGQRDAEIDSLIIADDYVAFLDKPFTPQRLLSTIRQVCAK
jgi:two-component system C4-dicarboxylate transport response regulator DctD